MKTFPIFLLTLIIIACSARVSNPSRPLRRSSDGTNTKHECECTEGTINGNYCQKWVCHVDYECFPSFATVNIINKGIREVIMIKDLRIGDCVVDNFTSNASCTIVTAISHREAERPGRFAQIYTENHMAYASYEHLIHVSKKENNQDVNKLNFKRICDLNIGDQILTKSGREYVVQINYKDSVGIYSPHTESGLIVVNNVLFSTYGGINDHHLAHLFFGVYNTIRDTSGEADIIMGSLEKMLVKIITSFL